MTSPARGRRRAGGPWAAGRALLGDRPGGGRPWAFAVEDDAVQVTWPALGDGPVTLAAHPASADGGPATPAATATGAGDRPGSAVLGGLPADAPVEVRVAHGERTWTLATRTVPAPPGALLSRFATLSDLHLAERVFGFWGTIQEDRPAPAPTTVRAARAALAEALAWGAEAVVLKGDLTAHGQPEEWEAVRALVRGCPVPILALPGNHDASRSLEALDPHELLAGLGVAVATPVGTLDLPGIRLVAGDTTRHGSNRGQVRHVADRLVHEVAGAPAAFVALHHQLLGVPVPTYWPPGVRSGAATPFLRRLAEANPATFVSSGHTHRHRRRQVGPVVATEVGSPKDFPGTWAGYAVHEGGIRQVVRRVADPDVLAWTDRTATAALGLWQHWSPGHLDDRCFTVAWPPGAARSGHR